MTVDLHRRLLTAARRDDPPPPIPRRMTLGEHSRQCPTPRWWSGARLVNGSLAPLRGKMKRIASRQLEYGGDRFVTSFGITRAARRCPSPAPLLRLIHPAATTSARLPCATPLRPRAGTGSC